MITHPSPDVTAHPPPPDVITHPSRCDRPPTPPDVTSLPRELLPDNAEVASDGRLSIGGVAVLELAEEYGTPLFVYDEAHLRARCREAVELR